MFTVHSLLLIHLRNDGVMLLWLCQSPLTWCIFLCKFSPSPSLFHASLLLADVVRNHFIPTMNDFTQTMQKPSVLQEKWACQPKRIIYWTNNRKHALSCHWLIFQINLELYYIILSIPENPQFSLNWKTTSSILVFCTILSKCNRDLKQYIALVAYEFCQLESTLFA